MEHADVNGRLRGILEAVRSNRVEDDFSEHWSYATGGLRARALTQARQDQGPVRRAHRHHPGAGTGTEIEDNLVFADFLALLDKRERQVVLLLRSGITKVGDVASAPGYKSHSPVSKRLALIRKKAAAYFGDP